VNGLDHYAEAERLLADAEAWADADHGWRASLSSAERLARRQADTATAQVHATLALVAVVVDVVSCALPELLDQFTGLSGVLDGGERP